MRKCVNKKLTALFLTAVMGGSLCADMTVFAEEVTDQEVIISETEGKEVTASKKENQVEAEPESDESEKPLEELPETTPNEEVGNAQVENENNGLEEKSIATQSNGISLQSIEGVCGEKLTWSLDETTGTLTISGSGDMDDYDYYSPWSGQREQISRVILEDGVTSIGTFSFEWCNNLKEIEIPDSVTKICEGAFSQCTSLQNITIPNSVKEIGSAAFEGCASLQSVTIPNSVTEIGGNAFSSCTSLQNITIPNSVKEIGPAAFEECVSLQSVTIPNSVTEIGDNAFFECVSLQNITLPDSVIEISSYAFARCSSLKSIYVPRGVERLDNRAFGFNENLESINVADENAGYTSQEGVLYDKNKTTLMCYPGGKKAEQFNIPNGVKSIMEYAFAECQNLQKVVFPDGMNKIGCGAFDDCISLQNIEIPSSVTEIDEWAFNKNINLKDVVLPEGLKKISMGAFRGCDKLMILNIPKTVSEIGEFAYGYRFVEDGYPGDPHLRYPNAKIKCYTNTAGHKYAKDNGIPYELLDGKKTVNVSKITVSGISNKIAAGKKIKLTAKVSPSNATNKSVKWTSSNKKVATVNSKGVVTINKKAGGKSVSITAAATDGSKKKATYKISVMKGVVKKVAISGNKSVKAGKTLKLKAKVTATKKANKKLKWTSSNKKYATVNSSGKVKTYKAGKGKKVKITAEATDGSGKKKSVTIKIK